MIKITQKGDFKKTFHYLDGVKKIDLKNLMRYGEKGVAALAAATPKDTGLTADSWYYRIIQTKKGVTLEFLNSNLGDGWAPIAILLQYGHATGNGGYVEGRDYINPAIQPIFDEILNELRKEVSG